MMAQAYNTKLRSYGEVQASTLGRIQVSTNHTLNALLVLCSTSASSFCPARLLFHFMHWKRICAGSPTLLSKLYLIFTPKLERKRSRTIQKLGMKFKKHQPPFLLFALAHLTPEVFKGLIKRDEPYFINFL